MPALQGKPWSSASLMHLKLQDCHIGAGLAALTIPSLQELCMVHCCITGLVTLSGCSQLTKVTMQGGSADPLPGDINFPCKVLLRCTCLAAQVALRGVC